MNADALRGTPVSNRQAKRPTTRRREVRENFPAPSDAEQAARIMLADLLTRQRFFMVQYGPRIEALREELLPYLQELRGLINSQIAVVEILLLLRAAPPTVGRAPSDDPAGSPQGASGPVGEGQG